MRKIIFALAFLVPSLCLATVMIPLDLNQLTDQADKIVLGHCINKRVYQTGKMIWTEYTFQVYEVLKGEGIKEVKIRQPGGELNGNGVMVPGTASFSPFEENLLFLDKEKEGSRDLVGWAQGRFKVYYDEKTKSKYTFQNLSGISFVKKNGDTVSVEPMKVDLEQIKAQIKTIVAQKKVK